MHDTTQTKVILNDWKSDHLFLLIGGNPLPNYVAAKLLLAENGVLHLVHSPETKTIADNITGFFPKHLRHEVSDSASRAAILSALTVEKIQEALEKQGLPLCTAQEKIGLNYTGGTKTMSVHAYEAVMKQFPNAVCTYLDSRKMTLRRADKPTELFVQYAMEPQPNVLDFFKLHGIELLNDKRTGNSHAMQLPPIMPQLELALAQAHRTRHGQEAYAKWCGQHTKFGKNTTQRVSIPTDKLLIGVADEMRNAFDIVDNTFDPHEIIADEKMPFTQVRVLARYLDGTWLEEYVGQAFIQNRECCCIDNVAKSSDLAQSKMGTKFEIDVLAMQGYQMYAASCTRSKDRKRTKHKLFEAYIRAAQLGGDEARVTVVCADEEPEELEQEVNQSWRLEQGKVRVFGAKDLPDLANRFHSWMSV